MDKITNIKVNNTTYGVDVAVEGGYLSEVYDSDQLVIAAAINDLNSRLVGLDSVAATVNNLADVATSGSYNDLSNKPAINNATLTIKLNNSTVGSFTANASSDSAVNITVPTKTSDLTNDVPFVEEADMWVTGVDANGHEWIEIGGLKWATMNIGATSVTDAGLYFQWGDTNGYTASQLGSGEGLKYFDWADYKWTNNGGSTFTKYNSTDNKTVLDPEDDAAVANWGGTWRTPTLSEIWTFKAAVTMTWTLDYLGSGVAGAICVDNTDSSKVLFFPACGDAGAGRIYDSGRYAWFMASTRSSDTSRYSNFGKYSDGKMIEVSTDRCIGTVVRAILDTATVPKYATKTELSTLEGLVNTKIGETINKTWSQLKAMRDGGTLTPGQWYRITDYTCTTTQTNTQSAGHAFDIIVRADANNVLNENAYAAKHSGDTYFANSKLEAWKLKYCIDNDTTRFVWAMMKSDGAIVTSNGIFPYVGEETIDGITYQKWKPATPLFDVFEYVYTKNGSSTVYGLYNGTIENLGFSYTSVTQPTEEEGCGVIYWMKDEFNNECPYDFKNILFSIEDNYYYTFNVAAGSSATTDYSLNGAHCFENKIKLYKINNVQNLNRIVFKNMDGGSDCSSNTFGHNCHSNTFDDNCHSNTFGNGFYQNIFGNNFYYNTFGDNCQYNTFGDNCYQNIFGSDCGSNTFDNFSHHNTFDDNCSRNTFGNFCQYNTFSKAFTKYVIIENGNSRITLTSTATTSYSSPLQNIKISQGVNNTSTTKTISHNTVNDTFQTIYQPTNSQTISV